MSAEQTTFITKLKWNLPWLARYPFERAANRLQQNAFEKKHIIFTIADHFEPKYVRLLLDEHTKNRRDHSHSLWILWMLELWHRQFVDG